VETNGRRLILPWRSPYGGVKRWIEHDLPEAQRQTPVKIAIENMPAHQVARRRIDLIWWNTVDEWSRIHDWLTLDTTHWATKGVNPLDAYRAANGRVCHVHLSNFDGHEHRLLHTGRVDLGSLLRALAADCYAGTISVELQPDVLEFTDDAKVRGHLAASLAFCRAHLDTE